MRILPTVLLVGLTVVPSIAQQRSKKADLLVDLRFTVQESLGSNSAALSPSMLDQVAEVRIQDARNHENLRTLGAGTDDDDLFFPIIASTDVAAFVTASVEKMAQGQGLKIGPDPARRLHLRLTKFMVNESNKAVGSTYAAEVHFAFTLLAGDGTMLLEGAASGQANRYGRARSAANCSEVLSDAMKDAFMKIIGDDVLQSTWASGRPASAASASAVPRAPAASTGPAKKESIEVRLKKLDELLSKGLITKEEHATARAAILVGGL